MATGRHIKVKYKHKPDSGMSQREFAQLGGYSRARSMTPEQRKEASRKAGKASAGVPRPSRQKGTPEERMEKLLHRKKMIDLQIERIRQTPGEEKIGE